jgi:large subunit ribosomal protein L24
MSQWLKNGDRVMVIAGNDKGKTGTVVKRTKKDRILVEGINLKSKALRPTEEAPRGRIVKVERPLHQSNVMLCPEGEKVVRLKVRVGKEGQRELVYGPKGKETVYRTVK